VQYDFGKATPSGFQRTGFLNTPPAILLNAVAKLQSDEFRERSRLLEYLSKIGRLQAFNRKATGPDILYRADYDHRGGEATCKNCDMEYAIPRNEQREVTVHYGIIASGNQVIRNAAERNKVSLELGGVLCFEMEAAGLMNSFPCLVVRGICDYADSHKNKQWQPYAAGTAAAYAKEVLSAIPSAADPLDSSNLIQPRWEITEPRQGNWAKLTKIVGSPADGRTIPKHPFAVSSYMRMVTDQHGVSEMARRPAIRTTSRTPMDERKPGMRKVDVDEVYFRPRA
jgi:hypothetical protein